MGERYFLRDLKSIKSHLHLDIQTNICNKLEKDLPLTSVGTWWFSAQALADTHLMKACGPTFSDTPTFKNH